MVQCVELVVGISRIRCCRHFNIIPFNMSSSCISPHTLLEAATSMNIEVKHENTSAQQRRFLSAFGVSPLTTFNLWLKLMPCLPKSEQPKHLLWALLFLKKYNTEHIYAGIAKVDEKRSESTHGKWFVLFQLTIGTCLLMAVKHSFMMI